MDLSVLLPENLGPITGAVAIAAAFFSAALTAAFGLGGGLILLAVLAAIFPAPAIIPVHGVAQLGSNFGRAALHIRDAVWPIILWFTAGGLLGALIGGRLAVEAPVWVLRAGVGVFILYTVWGPRPASLTPGNASFFATGAIGSFLTMFFGATGPIAATMLSATNLDRLRITATHASCMVAQHGLKVIIFGALGFAYAEWMPLILAMLASGFAGTTLGSNALRRMPEAVFKTGFKVVLTVIAAYMLTAAAIDVLK